MRALTLATNVNGEVRQSAKVADLTFDIRTLLETMSATMTLLAGDIIATGTPAGVGIGSRPTWHFLCRLLIEYHTALAAGLLMFPTNLWVDLTGIVLTVTALAANTQIGTRRTIGFLP